VGALALALIPVFAEHIHTHGRSSSWKLFSKIANILFLVTLVLAVVFAIFAEPIVASRFGISPGFSSTQQALVVELMRINLIAMIIFSLSGLIMATLQAHKHFLLPAIAPIMYNIGLIIGVVFFSPAEGMQIGSITLPAYNLGIHGLVYGTVLGALLHLLVQIPGIVKHEFSWTAQFGLKDPGVRKVFRLMAPRIATVFLIQLTFLARDNIASHLPQGSITALTYGYFILQVPETLIGTAIATALLPTLSELVTKKQTKEFIQSLKRAIQILLASTIVISLVIGLLLPQLVDIVFNFDQKDVDLLVWATRGYLVGLFAHALLEVVTRAFYAKQDAMSPLKATAIRVGLFLALSGAFVGMTGAVGLAFIDSLTVAVEVAILCVLLYKMYPAMFDVKHTLVRVITGSVISIGVILAMLLLPFPPFVILILSLLLSAAIYLLFVREEIKLLLKL
jgi:putative peptidoglycan lipid II flippase